MLKQNKPYGCGIYAVTNACNLPEFATPERIEKSKIPGSSNGSLSAYLQEDGKPFYLQPQFYNANAKDLPDEFKGLTVSGVTAWPLVFCVTISEGGIFHMIGANLFPNKQLIVYDSLKSEPFLSTLNDLHENYYSVFGMYSFCDLETGDDVFIS